MQPVYGCIHTSVRVIIFCAGSHKETNLILIPTTAMWVNSFNSQEGVIGAVSTTGMLIVCMCCTDIAINFSNGPSHIWKWKKMPTEKVRLI